MIPAHPATPSNIRCQQPPAPRVKTDSLPTPPDREAPFARGMHTIFGRGLRFLWAVALGAVALTACRPAEYVKPVPARTLLVYMGGDNNLASEAAAKVEALRQGWRPAEGQHLLVYLDKTGSTPELFEIVRSGGVNITRTIRTYSSENSASPVVLSRVIDEVRTLYPASSYGLVVFSHASGWLPQGALINPYGVTVVAPSADTKSVLVDGIREMELADFAAAIPDRVFDYIVFEACFMAGIEVAYELRNKCNYILASSAEIVAPGFTDVYAGSAAQLAYSDVTLFANRVFAHVAGYAENDYRRSGTFSVIRTAALEPLAAFLHERRSLISSAYVDPLTVQRFDRNVYRLFFDFGDYYSRTLTTEADRAELSRLIGEAVPWCAATPSFMPDYSGFRIDRHSGLTLYIPQPQFPGLNSRYERLAWRQRLKR